MKDSIRIHAKKMLASWRHDCPMEDIEVMPCESPFQPGKPCVCMDHDCLMSCADIDCLWCDGTGTIGNPGCKEIERERIESVERICRTLEPDQKLIHTCQVTYNVSRVYAERESRERFDTNPAFYENYINWKDIGYQRECSILAWEKYGETNE